MSDPRDPGDTSPSSDDTLDAPPGSLPKGGGAPANPSEATVLLPEDTASGRATGAPEPDTRDEAFGGQDLDERLIEAAIRRGLITAKQATRVLIGKAPARESLIRSGLVSEQQAAELEEEVRHDFIPGFKLIGELGRGAMGVVFKAIQSSLDRTVALKVVNPRQAHDPQFVQRFQQEAKALARLNHPNIVQVYDHGESRGQLYIALEFVKGTDCADVLSERGHFSPTDALRVIRDAAVGLAHAHAEGIIHRDIKPANLMLAEASGGGSHGSMVKVTDLGLARLQESQAEGGAITTAGTVLGSPAYMAPEQTFGEPADFRSDIYGLGATLYHLLTGKAPFEGESALKILTKKSTVQLPNPADEMEGIAADVILILDRMLAREREDRYPSYEALLADLDAVLQGEAPRTGPVARDRSSLLPPRRVPPTRRLAQFEGDEEAAPRGQAVTHQAPSALPRVLALAGVIVATVFGAWHATREQGGGATPTPPPTSAPTAPPTDVAALVEALERLDDRGALQAEAALTELEAGLAALPAAQRTSLRLRVQQRLRAALDALETEHQAQLEQAWADGDYAALARGVATLEARYARIEQPLPADLRRWSDLSAAAAGDAGQRERQAWATARAAQDPREVLRLLEGFAEAFPFSPALDAAAEARASAERQAPRVTLAPTPDTAALTLDGEALGAGRWEGRLLLGEHTLRAEAEGCFPLARTLVVEGPQTLPPRPGPRPRQALQQSPRNWRVWNPRSARGVAGDWTVDGEWLALPEQAGIQGAAHRSGAWGTATRDLTQLLPRVCDDGQAWQLEWKLDPPAQGLAEVQLLAGPDGQRVVVGVEPARVYLGLRRGDALEVVADLAFTEPPGYYQLDWDGDVALLRARDERVGSLRPGWTPAAPPTLTLAVRGTRATFRDLFLHGLVPAE